MPPLDAEPRHARTPLDLDGDHVFDALALDDDDALAVELRFEPYLRLLADA